MNEPAFGTLTVGPRPGGGGGGGGGGGNCGREEVAAGGADTGGGGGGGGGGITGAEEVEWEGLWCAGETFRATAAAMLLKAPLSPWPCPWLWEGEGECWDAAAATSTGGGVLLDGGGAGGTR